MSAIWRSQELPEARRIGALGWALVAVRGGVLGGVVFGGLLVLLLLRLVERPLFAPRRPVTPFITQTVCRLALILLGLRLRVRGPAMHHKGAIVANHSSWLDIFVLNAVQRVYFVSKAEVAGWPGIGWLARATGTVFIRRTMRDAPAQKVQFERRLAADHRLLFFPEGTSTDGKRVLTFKPTLFQALFADGMRDRLWVQPVSVIYHAPHGQDPRFYGWWDDMEFAPHLLKVLAVARRGRVDVVQHAPVRVADFADRKALAAYCESVVRSGLDSRL